MPGDNDGKLKFGIFYDFRNPPQWRRPYEKIYADILDQIAWAENLGFDYVWISEHHFTEDGYAPSLFPIAAAIAARTKKIRIATGVALLPLYHPVRLAEDAATVDVISGGRFELGVGVGYKLDEFRGLDIDIHQRAGRMDEGLEIIKRLWAGEKLDFKGKHDTVGNVAISPEPVQKNGPPIWIGGFVRASLRRAVRFGDGFFNCGGDAEELYGYYREELAEAGKPAENLRIADCIHWLIVSETPEKTWDEAADGVIYQVNKYNEWLSESGFPGLYDMIRDKAHLKELGRLIVVDPETCIGIIKEKLSKVPITHLTSWAIPPGMPARWAEPHLKLFAEKVIPAFR